jgi:hypothetical protein
VTAVPVAAPVAVVIVAIAAIGSIFAHPAKGVGEALCLGPALPDAPRRLDRLGGLDLLDRLDVIRRLDLPDRLDIAVAKGVSTRPIRTLAALGTGGTIAGLRRLKPRSALGARRAIGVAAGLSSWFGLRPLRAVGRPLLALARALGPARFAIAVAVLAMRQGGGKGARQQQRDEELTHYENSTSNATSRVVGWRLRGDG